MLKVSFPKPALSLLIWLGLFLPATCVAQQPQVPPVLVAACESSDGCARGDFRQTASLSLAGHFAACEFVAVLTWKASINSHQNGGGNLIGEARFIWRDCDREIATLQLYECSWG